MVTTILAIYGALVATASLAVTGWTFVASGPRLQATAHVWPPLVDEGADDWGHDWTVYLDVWNTGRGEIKLDVEGGLVLAEQGSHTFDPVDWHGPDLPMRLPGHSGEHWIGTGFDLRALLQGPPESAELTLTLEVGGKREMVLHLSGWQRWINEPWVVRDAPT